jgi:hypothetical protein
VTDDDDFGNTRLLNTSPCIDRGSNAAVPAGITTDIAGNPRIVDFPGVRDPGAIVDMGAYEMGPVSVTSGVLDLNGLQPVLVYTFSATLSTTDPPGDVIVNVVLPGGSLGATVPATPGTPSGATMRYLLSPTTADGNYRALLPGGAVADAGGNPNTPFAFDFFLLAGDANRDRVVDIADLGVLASNWQQSPRVFSQGDFNFDGTVDITDLAILASNWQKNLPPAFASRASRPTPIAASIALPTVDWIEQLRAGTVVGLMN